MHGDFSRSTFDATKGYRAVRLQQGRVLLDADWNEQTQLTAHHDEVRTLDAVGRSGGPLAEDGPGPFAILAADGSVPDATPWADLVVTPGRYYVDGVLAESAERPRAVGWPLADQPFLAQIGSGVTASPGLPEPPAGPEGARYALYLEVSEHGVTADEDPRLRESALGGPDTGIRAQTTWQVRWERLEGDLQCSDLHRPDWLRREPRTMVADLVEAADDEDPCRITSTGGYRRLENQLYRVQVHTGGDEPTFLWSRENGSVVARLEAMVVSRLPGVDHVLTLDRAGRDEELSIREGDLVEVTSTGREQRHLPGFLARAGAPDDVELPVAWLAGAPTSVAALGPAPVVRRWEGGPTRLGTTATVLEDGLTVRFPAGGRAEVGDHWLVPARAVRLAYGLSELRGTIDWPAAGGAPLALPPVGPARHVTPLAVLRREPVGWTRVSDCRTLFPPSTRLVTLDLVSGDGQEDLPGEWLDQPVRVVVRNGGVPVNGARVRFTAESGGTLEEADAEMDDGTNEPVEVLSGHRPGEPGVAAVAWRLREDEPTTQTLRVSLLDDHGRETGVAVVATARLSLASEVAWSHADCDGLSEVRTVAQALDRLVEAPELRLRGGDGQFLPAGKRVLPQPVRVTVDNACGPIGGARVHARSTPGARVRAVHGEADAPPDLRDSDLTEDVGVTASRGDAQFWWEPDVSGGSDILAIRLVHDDEHDGGDDGDPLAPIVVVAQRADADDIGWARECPPFEDVRSVGQALDTIVVHPELRLQGGDGQHLPQGRLVLPQPVRLVVDSLCGPVAGLTVRAQATGKAFVAPGAEGTAGPADLSGGSHVVDPVTDERGGVLLWWQPDLTDGGDTLTVWLPGHDDVSRIVVTAQATPRTGRTPGVHITRLQFQDGSVFENDQTIAPELLSGGVVVLLDGPVDQAAIAGKPVARVELDLPWPLDGEGGPWGDGSGPVATRVVTLLGDVTAYSEGTGSGRKVGLRWSSEISAEWLEVGLWEARRATGYDGPLPQGRFVLEGWALPSSKVQGQHVNTHAVSWVDQGRTRLRLPTDDEVTGGTFVQWFRLAEPAVLPEWVVPQVVGLPLSAATQALRDAGITVRELRTAFFPGMPHDYVLAVEPPAGTVLTVRPEVALTVSRGAIPT